MNLLVACSEVKDRRACAVEMRVALPGLPAPIDIIATDPDEIAPRGHLVGTVLWPALRYGKVMYEQPACPR